ncbi:hypothetical protein NFI96_028381, partial [Prochilodus magdalenae]
GCSLCTTFVVEEERLWILTDCGLLVRKSRTQMQREERRPSECLRRSVNVACMFFAELSCLTSLLPLAVQCYQCLPDASGTCTDTQTTCTDQCASKTHFMNYSGEEQQVSVKGCAAAEMCIRKSMNLGLWKTTLNTQCCSTDLCNSEIPPGKAKRFGVPNGRRCYTCVDNDCTIPLNCEGIEDRCITIHVQCYQCIPDASGTCTDTQTSCTDQCASMTYFTNYGGQEYLYSVKDCAAECITGSINLGVWKESINTKCCSTDLCNNQTLPALSGSPNGRRCYTCVGNDCTKTLNCEGIEDRCITVHGECLRRSVNVACMFFAELSCLTSLLPLAVQCYQCLPDASGTCTDTPTSCTDQCASATYFTNYGGQEQQVSVKNCTATEECITGSLNLGVWKETVNTKCCSTNLCNRKTLPEPTLSCYQCKPDASGTCKTTQAVCTDHCASVTTFVRSGGQEHAISAKGCAAIEECVSGSMNLGVTKTAINTKCCSTDLCNRKTLPALSGTQNGRSCYTCVDNDCRNTLNCVGDENRCITVNATDSGTPVTMKGCASKSVCNASKSSIWGKKKLTIIEMSCCKGNMCNSAADLKLSLLIMLVSLLSSFFL